VLRVAREQATSEDFERSHLAQCAGSAGAITNELLAECFRAGDEWTVAVVRLAMEPLGWMLAMLRSAIGVPEYVLVGGFANALGPRLCDELAGLAAEASWNVGREWTRSIELGELGNAAGLIGGGRVGTAALNGG
jgi:glucokinase